MSSLNPNQNFSYRNDIRANDILTGSLTTNEGLILPDQSVMTPPKPEGSIGYDTVLEKIIFSNGTEWVVVDTGTAQGTVTEVDTGTGLTGGPITTTGTISIADTGVAAGSYTAATITVNAQGQITSATSNPGDVQVWQAAADTTIPSQINIEYNTPTVNLTDAFVTNSLTTEGTGTRMQFTQDGAFRAGLASSSQWNAASRGTNSTALGNSCIALGTSSVAMGNSCVASGVESVVMGTTVGDNGNNNCFVWSDGTGSGADGSGQFIVAATGGSAFQVGGVGIGLIPKNALDVSGDVAIGTYAGVDTAPTNGLIVSGNVGIGTHSPLNALDISGAAVIGAAYAGTDAAPGNGLIVEGPVGLGTPIPKNQLDVNGSLVVGTYAGVTTPAVSGTLLVSGPIGLGSVPNAAANPYNMWIGRNITLPDASENALALYNNTNFNLTTPCSFAVCYDSNSIYATTGTINWATAFFAHNRWDGNTGTITNAAHYYSNTGNGTVGTITNGYGGYFLLPSFGTNKASLYTADLSVGVAPSASPTAGTIKTAPPVSSAAAFTIGTPLQNLLGYDAHLTVYLSLLATATVSCGVGPTSSPTQQTLVTSGIAGYFPVSVIVPYNYYVLINASSANTTGLGHQWTPL